MKSIYSIILFSFMWNEKEWAKSKLAETERERLLLRKGCGVAAWIINLTVGQLIYEG